MKAPGSLLHHTEFLNPGARGEKCCTCPQKNPPATSPRSPVLSSVSPAVAVTSLVCGLAGLGSAVPRRCRWEKPRSRSGLCRALPLLLRPRRACSALLPAQRWPRDTSPASAPSQPFLGRLTLSSQTKAKK